MKQIIFTCLVLLAIGSVNVSMADEFGDRFQNETPAGMADYTYEDEIPNIAMDDMAKNLQNIMPAAGEDETVFDEKKEDPSHAPDAELLE